MLLRINSRWFWLPEDLTENRKMNKEIDWLSIFFTALIHLLVGLLLWFVAMRMPDRREESGVPVMLGNMGDLNTDYEFTEVESFSIPVSGSLPDAALEAMDPIVTQDMEETVAIESGKKETVKKPVEEVHQPTEAELRAQREKDAATNANQLMSVFGQTTTDNSQTADALTPGVPGSLQGNATKGKTEGVGGYGTYDLNGRSVGDGGLVRPVYRVQDEGRVVVTITVSPEGRVIATSINKRTNTVNTELREAAEAAARNTKFNAVSGPDNQSGTITYYFKLK